MHLSNGDKEVFIRGLLSRLSFEPNYSNNFGYFICSEATYKELIGSNDYAVIDIHLDGSGSEQIQHLSLSRTYFLFLK